MAFLTQARSLLLVVAVLLPLSGFAQGNALETRIKATFLYKFCQYVTWPSSQFDTADAAIVIAVVGDPYMAEELRLIVAGRVSNGRSMLVRQLQFGDPLEGVHMVFFGAGNRAQQEQNLPLLTVTESLDDNHAGMINFVLEHNKVRFDIAKHKAEQVGLRLSSQLLSVARRVNEGTD